MKNICIFLFSAVLWTALPLQSAANSDKHRQQKKAGTTAKKPVSKENQSKVSFTPLPAFQTAAKNNDVPRVFTLIQRGIRPQWQDHTGATAVHWAAAFGSIDALRVMISNDIQGVQDCLTIQDNEGKTPLHRAVGKDSGCTELLVSYAPNETIDFRDNQGSTALMWAASVGNDHAVNALLERGADVNAHDTLNIHIPMLCALRAHNTALIKKVSPASLAKCKSSVRLIAEHKANLCLRDNTGATAVHSAAALGNTDAVRDMIANNCTDVQTCLTMYDNENKTPLHRAVGKDSGCTELLAYYAPKEAIDMRDGQGSTPLMWAASVGNQPAAMALLSHGANVNAQDLLKLRTPLHWALRMRSGTTNKGGATVPTQTVQALLQALMRHDANPNIQDADKRSPIDWTLKHTLKREYTILTGEKFPQ